jgi:hypothetical protein
MLGLASETPSGLTINFAEAGITLTAGTVLISICLVFRLEHRSNKCSITSALRGGQPGSSIERITLYSKKIRPNFNLFLVMVCVVVKALTS